MNKEMNKELGFLLFPLLNHLSVTKVLLSQIIFLINILETGLCLECYRCYYYASDPSLCRHHVTCKDGESCGQLKFDDYLGSHYDLDCIETSKCHVNQQTDQPVFIIGKKRREITDTQCCDTDKCYVDSIGPVQSTTMTTSTYSSPSVSEITTTASPDSCVDHPNCDILMEEFDACNDTEVAMTVCRKSCHMCDVTTMAPLCIDIHQDCQLLSDHLNVCRDKAFARTRCPKTCGVCGTTHTQSISNIDLTFTQPIELTSSIFNQTETNEQTSTVMPSVTNSITFPMTSSASTKTAIDTVTSSASIISTTTTVPATTTVTSTATPCTDTLSVESCRDALNKDPSSCSDVFIRKMCAFSCQLCSTQAQESTSYSTSYSTPIRTSHTNPTKPSPTTTQTTTTPTTTTTTTPTTAPSPTTPPRTQPPNNQMGVVVVGK